MSCKKVPSLILQKTCKARENLDSAAPPALERGEKSGVDAPIARLAANGRRNG